MSFKTLSLPDRDLWTLCGEIDDEVGTSLLQVSQAADPFRPVLLQISSGGGDALLSLAAADALHARFERLETRGLGFVASAAVQLLQAGRHRTASRYTTFCTHEMSTSDDHLTNSTAQEIARQFQRDVEMWCQFMNRRCGRPVRFWRDFFDRERWFTAAEAKKLGLIDAVV